MRVLAVLLLALTLFGCQSEPVILLKHWTFEFQNTQRDIQLPAHVDDALPKFPARYSLNTHVDLPESYVGRDLTLVIPQLHTRADLYVNGIKAPLLEDAPPSDYRLARPHRFSISGSALTSPSIELRVEAQHLAPWTAWWDTVPRLSATPNGDRYSLFLRSFNLTAGYGALVALVISVPFLLIMLWVRRDERYLDLVLASVAGLSPPILNLGLAQPLLSPKGDAIARLALGLTALLLASRAAVAGLRAPWRHPFASLAIVAGHGLILLTAATPYEVLLRAQFFTPVALLLAAGTAMTSIQAGRPFRVPRLAVQVNTAWLSFLPIFNSDSFPWLGYGTWTGGFDICDAAIIVTFFLNSSLLAIEFREQQQGVQRLDLAYRRQMQANAAELALALAQASAEKKSNDVQVGEVIDSRYELLRPLGSGAMGTVFEAKTVDDGKRFAIKTLTGPADSEALARLAREAESALRVDSPYVVATRDMCISGSRLFLVMDLVNGPVLSHERHRFGEMAWCVTVLRQVAQGLEHIHACGVTHRDIKPSNILLSYEEHPDVPRVWIADFGVSALRSSHEGSVEGLKSGQGLTRTGHVLGTPAYMAPEAFAGGKGTVPASDIFSFGVMARVIFLQAPLSELPLGLLVAAGGTTQLSRLADHIRGLDRHVAELLDQCLAADPTARPSAEQLRKAFAVCEAQFGNASFAPYKLG